MAKTIALDDRKAMPKSVKPMLCTLVKEPFDNKDWIFEIKWDGYRAITFIENGIVKLLSRNQNSLNDKFPLITKELSAYSGQAILDGELVVLDSEGKSHFQLVQNYQKTGQGSLFYYAFDMLYKDGYDLTQLPLIERKELLKNLLSSGSFPHIRYSDHVEGRGTALFNEAKKKQLEGIVGKKKDSTYQFKRSKSWIKIKTSLRQEVIIGGFTAPKGTRKKLGALLVGVYDRHRELIYVGHVGGGFNSSLLNETYDLLKPLVQLNSPFKMVPKTNAPVHWVKPILICEVSFAEWTTDNKMRQPIFLGFRTDKSPKDVRKEG